MTSENLPPLPGSAKPPEKPAFVAYVLRGADWVEIGGAVPHEDGKGYRLKLALGVEDGAVIELRAVDPSHYPGSRGQRPRRSYAARRAPRQGRG